MKYFIRKHKLSKLVDIEFTPAEKQILNYLKNNFDNLYSYQYGDRIYLMSKNASYYNSWICDIIPDTKNIGMDRININDRIINKLMVTHHIKDHKQIYDIIHYYLKIIALLYKNKEYTMYVLDKSLRKEVNESYVYNSEWYV